VTDRLITAREVGEWLLEVSHGSVYRHFPNEAALGDAACVDCRC
jgi:AcrR family transcriptional regulator